MRHHSVSAENFHSIGDGTVKKGLLHIVEMELLEVHFPVFLGRHSKGLLRCLLSLSDSFKVSKNRAGLSLGSILAVNSNKPKGVSGGRGGRVPGASC